jgi:DNA-binding SARP family transcriptional activator/TolB-like protein
VISIHVLGAPVVRRPDGPITGRAAHRRRLALLAILAAARGRPVGRERIIGLLWPDNTTDAARHTLSEGLYILRKELGEGSFVAVGDEVGLDPARVRSDVDDFQRAMDEGRWDDAVRAYGGPFLDGFYVGDAPEFERWAEGERDRLARAYGRALEQLATAAEAVGDLVHAAEWWRRLLAHDAFSSRVALRLVRALERAGERPAALRAAEAHVLLLEQELGVGPDAELAGLMEELRRAPPSPVPRPAPSAGAVQDPGVDDDRPAPARAMERVEAAANDHPLPDRRSEAAAAPAGRPEPRKRRIGPRGGAAMGATAAVLVLAALAAALDPAPAPEPEYDPRRIAVLYLDDDSPGGELQYLANGLTEMLIHELSQVQALDIVSRNGVKPYRQGTVPFDTMVADLRVGTVVEGSVQRSADSVRVVVQLIDANTHSHLESKVVVRPLGDLFAVERAVSEEVTGFLRRRLGARLRMRQAVAERRSGPALELALRGEQAYADAVALHRSENAEDIASAARALAEADALLARAEAADPRWSRPTLRRAWVALQEASWHEGLARAAGFDSAVARAGRVLVREPSNARALEVRGTAQWTRSMDPDGDASVLLDGAERDLRAALAEEPSLASAWGTLSFVLYARGRAADSELAARRALEYDAYLEHADRLLMQRFFSALAAADYAAARDVCERGRRGFPHDWQFVECRLTLLRADPSVAPDPALAWRLVGELDAMDPPASAAASGRAYAPVYRRMVAAAVLARAGLADSARAVMARARVDAANDPGGRISLALEEAHVLLRLGDRDGARERLDVYLAQLPMVRPLLERNPQLGPLLRRSTGGAAP